MAPRATALAPQHRRGGEPINESNNCGVSKVLGGSHRHAELFGGRCSEGRFLDERDERTFANVCVVGGLAGVVMGIAIARIVAASAGWPTVVTAFSVVLSFGVSIAVGLAAGIYPAVRAASLDPIEALRYE